MTSIELLKQAVFAQCLLIKHDQPDFSEIEAWAREASRAARLLSLETKSSPDGVQSAAIVTPMQVIEPLVRQVEGLRK